ncbi:RHS repeat domain-containing protein [Defluviitalea phaphyphila]|uniref:RHS repeat domain-containing protein n=1 Tax=Defluviitalea phaphyphila TaxID=1473580 RepID=UPI00073047A5|nr:RHS repeat domain-containing protein [Defluviitalea phaphyphila]
MNIIKKTIKIPISPNNEKEIILPKLDYGISENLLSEKQYDFAKAYNIAKKCNKDRPYILNKIKNIKVCGNNKDPILLNGRSIKLGNCIMDIVKGDISKEYVDFDILCIGKNLSIKRFYNSNSKKIMSLQSTKTKGIGLLGYNWVIEYETYCDYSQDKLIVYEINGEKYIFLKQNEKWINTDERSLVFIEDEDFKRKEITVNKLGFKYIYSFDGRLKAIKDNNNNFLELRYINNSYLIDKIISSCGKSLSFKYENNKISEITDNIGRKVKYFYEDNYLIMVQQVNGGKYRFFYDDNCKKIFKIVDCNGNNEFHMEYSKLGTPKKLYYSNNLFWNITYNLESKEIIFHNEDFPITFKYDNVGFIKEIITNNNIYTYQYDTWGNIISKTDIKDYKQIYIYNQYNQLISYQSSDGVIENIFYNNKHLVSKIIKPNGYEKFFSYDSNNNLIEVREKIYKGMIAVTKYEYDANGRITKIIDPNKNITENIFKTKKSVFPEIIIRYSEKDKEKKEVIEREYDEVSRMIMENYLGVKTRFIYNNKDLLVQSISPNGTYDFRQYDPMGNLKEVILPKEIKESSINKRPACKYIYNYDENNILVSIKTPTGKVLLNDYKDENKKSLVEKIDTDIIVKYDYVGNILEKRIPVDKNEYEETLYQVIKYSYDKNQNIIQEKKGAEYVLKDEEPLTYEIKKYEYNGGNNITYFSSNSGEEIHYIYEGMDRLVKEIIKINDYTKQKIIYKYNEIGLLSEKIDLIDIDDIDLESEKIDIKNMSSAKIKTLYEYDENGNLTKITIPSGDTLVIEYDKNGDMIRSSNTEFLEYDYKNSFYLTLQSQKKEKKYNNIKKVKINTKQNLKYIYDKYNRIVKIIYPNGEYELFEYDCANNITKFIDKSGQVTAYTYNSINKIRKIITSDNMEIKFLYGLDGEVKKYEIENNIQENLG